MMLIYDFRLVADRDVSQTLYHEPLEVASVICIRNAVLTLFLSIIIGKDKNIYQLSDSDNVINICL